MVPMNNLVAFALTATVIIMIPGPSVLFTVGRALTVGRRTALLTVVGNAAGTCVQVLAAAFGMGALVERSVLTLSVIKYVGAAYIIYLGVQAFRHRRSMAEALAARITPVGPLRALRDGAFVGATNPKTIVLFVTIMPGFADPAHGSLPMQLLVLGSVFPVIALCSDSVWALIAATARAWFARSPRRLAAIGGVGGLALIGLGASIAVTGRKD